MPFYSYHAQNSKGKMTRGKVESRDEHQLYQELKEQGLYLISSVEIEKNVDKFRVKSKDLVEFTGQLGTMLSSGIALTRSLNIIVQRTTKDRLKKLYGKVHQAVLQGTLLSDALEQQGEAFPYLMINMIRAGEASGQLEKVAMKLSLHYEKDAKLQTKLRNAMIYPCIILALTVGVIMLVFTVIMPKLFSVFEKQEDLPAVTKVMIGFSRYVSNNWLVTLIFIALFVAIIIFIARLPKVVLHRHKMYLRIPVLKGIMSTIYTARFARGLASLYSSGLSMVQSLQICQGLVNNHYIEKMFPAAIEQVKNGVPLSSAIREIDGLDSKLVASIYVGEESGKITEILERLADNYDYEADQATGRMVTFIEPILIIFMAVVVGSVMVSVLLPIYTYYQSLG